MIKAEIPPTKLMLHNIKKAIKWVLIGLIKLYQAILSPFLGPSCRHMPTCSSYTIEAIEEWGALKGFWLGLKRISRCHPWGTSGYDPVPKKKNEEGES
ncbi:membrane protein insertion efficiency factor YidD [Rhodohalobacter barkolensis]